MNISIDLKDIFKQDEDFIHYVDHKMDTMP